MAKRRGRGEGTISQRSDGRWMARVTLPGRSATGKRRRKTVYGSTRKDVAAELNKLLGRSATGELLTTSTPTMARWLNRWYTAHQREWSIGTRRVYRCVIDKWLVPALGAHRVDQLAPAAIQDWIDDVTRDGARTFVVTAHCILSESLKWAMRLRQVTFNAATCVTVPRPEPKPITPLTIEQAHAVLDKAGRERYGLAAVLALLTGLRIGEVLGVAWPHLDLDGRQMSVRQQVLSHGKKWTGAVLTLGPLKTKNSRRTLQLPEAVIEGLKAHRKRQLEERLRAGATWNNTHDLVFVTETGGIVNPGQARKEFRRILEAADIPRVRFHTLRHSMATLLLANGTQLFDVSRVLGHAQLSTTADIYGHFVPEMAANAAGRMDGLLKKAGSSA